MKLIRLRTTILFFGFFFLTTVGFANADDTLPTIDAHRFEAKPIQKSTSGKIYLFESNQVIPKTGNLILVYDQNKPAMAFRVLKNDRSKNRFVGKRVRRYDQTSELKLDQDYTSIEKLADSLPPPPGEVPSENLDEPPTLTKSTAPSPAPTPTLEITAPDAQDAELDSDSTASLDEIDELDETDDEEDGPLEVDETARIDPFNNILSVTAGYFGNSSNFNGSPYLSNGFSLSYAHKLFNDVFIMKKVPQDSLSLEFGGIFYRIINKDGGNDIYSMLPFFADLLYQLHLSTSFSINLYGGIQYNYMTSAINPGASLDILQGLQVNVGLGFFYTLGPQWLLRADFGWDRITGGLSLKW